MDTARSTPRHLRRRQFLVGVAGGAVAALLAACGTEEAATTAPRTGGAATTAATTAAIAAPATGATSATSATSATGATGSAGGAGMASGNLPPGVTGVSSLPGMPTAVMTSAITLELWGGGTLETGVGDIVDSFNRVYPNIKVNYNRFVNDDTGNTKLDTALQGGSTIDTYLSFDVPRMSQRIKAGVAEDLTPYIAADPAVKQWADSTQGLFRYSDSKLYSLPTVIEPTVMLINKKMFDAAGVKVPEKWTVDEFREVARRLSTGSGDNRVYGVFAPPDIARMTLGVNYWYNADGSASNFDNPAFRQSATLRRQMIDEKTAFPHSEILAQNLRVFNQDPFLKGQVAMWPTATWVARYVNDKEKYPHDFQTTFAPLPTPVGVEKPYTVGGINNWVMMHPKARNKQAAWAFLRYWLTSGSHYIMTRGGKLPAWPGVDQEGAAAGILGPDRATLWDVAAFRRVHFDPNIRLVTDTITTGLADIRSIEQQQADRLYLGEIGVDEYLTAMKRQADEAIKKAKA